jgi:hypothetical protein
VVVVVGEEVVVEVLVVDELPPLEDPELAGWSAISRPLADPRRSSSLARELLR